VRLHHLLLPTLGQKNTSRDPTPGCRPSTLAQNVLQPGLPNSGVPPPLHLHLLVPHLAKINSVRDTSGSRRDSRLASGLPTRAGTRAGTPDSRRDTSGSRRDSRLASGLPTRAGTLQGRAGTPKSRRDSRRDSLLAPGHFRVAPGLPSRAGTPDGSDIGIVLLTWTPDGSDIGIVLLAGTPADLDSRFLQSRFSSGTSDLFFAGLEKRIERVGGGKLNIYNKKKLIFFLKKKHQTNTREWGIMDKENFEI